MDTPPVHAVDYVLLVGLTVVSLGAGLYLSVRRRSRSRDEAFLGGRSIPSLPLAISAVASSVTAMSIIAFVAHYYVYGFHTLWAIPAFVPAGIVVTTVFLPVMYERRVTSIFEYLRMRYGNSVGIASSFIYFVLSQALGAVAIYSAAVAVSTMLGLSPIIASIILGVSGTVYTALGGLRSVVWADCIQGLIMTASPLIIIGKIVYDSLHSEVPMRPLTDFNSTFYFWETKSDITTDETVWAAAIGALPLHLVRLGLDQMITQRFLAAKSLRDAKAVAFCCIGILSFFYALNGITALAIIFWFRDCDPVLAGDIPRYDQIVPYYVNRSASALIGIRGLFLAGVISASISTISSIVNSHAAVLYVDIVSPYIKIPEDRSSLVMAALAAGSGTIMTLTGLLVPYIGSAARFFIALYAAASGPFAGIIILATCFPWANAKGTATAALGVFLLQIWQTAGRFASKVEAVRMTYSVDRCPANTTLAFNETLPYVPTDSPDVFPMYRLSAYWCCLLATFLTVFIGLALSVVSARASDNLEKSMSLSSPVALRFWAWTGLLPRIKKEPLRVTVNDGSIKASPYEIQPLQSNGDDIDLLSKPTAKNGRLHATCTDQGGM
ncbi:putative sodium-dependent multivitamin transporter isoform X1 [Dermacentor silvarum]|uniref:putative sodium-dependent multivitamin transporter isoform X1 n=1 Tax=Dermacentor silvarum TaxID=543639 RepID=UPI002100C345|nr:putative sodium-dependent multivitamin transporter isoform X1 [Dermacentor silvarum]